MTGPAQLRWRPYGEFGALIELDSLEEVHRMHQAVRSSRFLGAQIIEAVPGATTLVVIGRAQDAAVLVRMIESLHGESLPEVSMRTHTIPVRYEGPDLADVATMAGLRVAEVVDRHAAPLYTVAFLGFSRSFPYLAGLDPALHVPRRATPRTSVPKGSVGIGAAFTGIYPASSPGGWQLLGRTEREFFDPAVDPPSVLAVGDRVRFVPIVLPDVAD